MNYSLAPPVSGEEKCTPLIRRHHEYFKYFEYNHEYSWARCSRMQINPPDRFPKYNLGNNETCTYTPAKCHV